MELSTESWAAYEAAFRGLRGAQAAINWFGEVPSFHDADLVALNLVADGPSSISVKLYRLEPTGRNARVLQAVDSRLIVFIFDEVVDLELESFGPRTELNALWLGPANEREGRPCFSIAVPQPTDLELLIEPHYGLSGWLRCRNISIEVRLTT